MYKCLEIFLFLNCNTTLFSKIYLQKNTSKKSNSDLLSKTKRAINGPIIPLVLQALQSLINNSLSPYLYNYTGIMLLGQQIMCNHLIRMFSYSLALNRQQLLCLLFQLLNYNNAYFFLLFFAAPENRESRDVF